MITSDEEGPSKDGTVKVIEELMQREQKFDWCLVGEPSSINSTGDNIRVGRRGSINIELEIKGKQGHAAYPERVDNPLHKVGLLLNRSQVKNGMKATITSLLHLYRLQI